ncbi:MAG: hypothetical protein ACK5LC_14425 [Coprobacillaceae bacterium]
MSPIKFDNLTKALDTMIKEIETTNPKASLAFSVEFAKDAKDSFIAHESGDLGDSGIKTPREMMKKGTVIWKTPYATKRYYENFKTPNSTEWDIRTWNKNSEKYTKQIAKIYDENIFR